MEHWQRHEPAPLDATFVEHIEVLVDAPTVDAGIKATKTLLGPEWRLRVVVVEKKQ